MKALVKGRIGLIAFLILFLSLAVVVRGEEPIRFPDPSLEQAIREAINKPTGDIYTSDLEGLTYLSASEKGIENLTGIEYCTNLTRLYLFANQISDVTPLANLTNLVELSLFVNNVTDVAPLSNLTQLTLLSLTSNNIGNISALASLTGLTHLDIGDNDVTDITALSNLTSLVSLGLVALNISDFSPLSHLINLMSLDLRATDIADVSVLSSLNKLASLDLRYNSIGNIEPIALLTNLEQLWLSENDITDISALRHLSRLALLELDHNKISNLQPLRELTDLEGLNLSNNQIADINTLSHLVNLRWLYLENNKIWRIDVLSNLTRLGQPTSWLCPPPPPDCAHLNLSNNMISDIQALVDNAGLGAEDRITIHYNYLDLSSGSDDMQNIQALIGRGVDVLYEPQNTPENQSPNTEIETAEIDQDKRTATFTWTGSDDTTPVKDLVYSYRLVRPGPAYDAWSSWISGETKKYTDLSPGNYKFQVRARDAEKVIDPSPASREFTIGEGALKCVIELRKQDTSTSINTIDINEPFDIYVGASTGNPEQVRFSSDESQDGTPTGEWTGWYDWNISSGDWNAAAKRMTWSFATSGKKEAWAEIQNSSGNISRAHADISVHPGYAIVVAGQGGWREKRGIDHSANNAYRALRDLGFDDDHIFYLNTTRPQDVDMDGDDEVDGPALLQDFERVMSETKNKIDNNHIPLVLYLSGHGLDDPACFVFDENNGQQGYLWVSHLKEILDAFLGNPPMLIMIGSCHSGVFIISNEKSPSSISANNRIIITNTDKKRILLGWVRSSDCFWGDLIKGLSIKEAFTRRTLPGDKQHLWLDDNGDAVGHPPHNLENDGTIAAITKIGTPGSDDLELKPWMFYWIRSPSELRVYDSQGRVTGLVNGEVKEEIPDSLYDEENKTVALFSLSGSYYCQVVGTDEGSYGLEISSIEGEEAITFVATDISTISGANHQYSIDWDALARGEEGVTLQVDNDGDGMFERTISSDSELAGEEFGFVPDGKAVNLGPNPVPADGCVFWLDLPEGVTQARLMIFSVSGRLVFETSLDVGSTRFPSAGTWNPVDNNGVELANGPYVYVLVADGKVIGQGKMVIQR